MSLFLIILVFVVAALLIVYLRAVIHGIYYYWRFVFRNKSLSEMVTEFNLSFQSFLPSFWKFIFVYVFRDAQINSITGNSNNHTILIKDMFYSSISNVIFQDSRRTIIEIDGKNIQGNLTDLTLGNMFILTTVDELHGLLSKLPIV